MKPTFKIAALFILVILMGASYTTLAIEKTKKYHEAWPESSIENLRISNKFGEIKFKNDGGTEITIDVNVTVESSNESRADDILRKINVSINKNGKTVEAETTLDGNFNGNNRFSIDYIVNVPASKNLWVSNKYGNVVVNQLNAKGEFDVQYGNISAVSLKGNDITIDLAYGKGNIESGNDMKIDISYSNISVGEIGNLTLESKYSSVDLDKAKNIRAESKYDKFDFDAAESVTAVTKYTQIKIGKLSKSFKIDNGYGGIKIESIDPMFESISITNSYGQISLGLNNASYTIDANCQYCGISYPEERFKGNRMKEDNRSSLNGKIGSAGGGTVKIDSRYGQIKLNE